MNALGIVCIWIAGAAVLLALGWFAPWWVTTIVGLALLSNAMPASFWR